jgi:hypothetical protein
MHAQLTPAPTETVFTLQSFANNNHARPLLAIPILENASILQLTAMTTMLVHSILAIATPVNAYTLLLIALTQTNVPNTLVTQSRDVFLLLWSVMTEILAPLTPATLAMDVCTLLSTLMIIMLAPKITVIQPLVSFTMMQFLATIQILARPILVTLVKDANIHQSIL